MSWGIPCVPLSPVACRPSPGGARVRYVVQQVEASPLSGPKETLWRVRLRQDQSTSGLTYLLHVAQRPGAPAPYDVGGLVELDPRLLEQE